MRRNVVFISVGMHAFGESILALNFARGLPPDKYEICLVVSPLTEMLVEQLPGIQSITLHRRAPKINQLLFEDFLEHHPPDIFVLCDFVTFDFAQAAFGITHEHLRAYGVPVVSIDSYEWESGDFSLDFFRGVEKKIPKTLLTLDGALRPCPINKPAAPTNRAACYSFFRQVDPEQGGGGPAWRKELGIAPEELVVFSADAMWQVRAETQQIPRTDLANKLTGLYLSRLERPAHWIRVGPVFEGSKPREGVIEHRFDSLPEEEFTRCLRASDLVVNTNVASTTLAKAVCYGKPALFLQNTRLVRGPGDLGPDELSEEALDLLETEYPIHPFYMFPLGWFKFLTPVLTDNPYLNTMHRAELLDEARILSILRMAEARRLPNMEEERESYLKLLTALPTPADCLERFMAAKTASVSA